MNTDPPRDGLAGQLETARAALYRPGADEAARARYRALLAVADNAVAEESVRAGGGRLANGGAAGASRRQIRLIVVIAVCLLAVAGGAALLTFGTESKQTTPALHLPLPDFVRREPSALPRAWRGAEVATSSDELDGATPLFGSGKVLLVVHCPSSDRSFQAVAGARTAYGACGRLQTIPFDLGAQVLVTTRGVAPFSAALLEHEARP